MKLSARTIQMKTSHVLLCGVGCLIANSSIADDRPAAKSNRPIEFARDIQPILNARCTECHGGVKAAGSVSFIYEDQVVNAEGDSGTAIVKPNDVDASELFYRIISTDDDRMPPVDGHAPLSQGDIALIRQWIEEGARWSSHWAFVPPIKPEVPASKFASKANNDLDRFLFHRLQEEGLMPAPIEQPGRLLRRLHLGLTGLPPTLKELNQFEQRFNIAPKQATEDVVDDLLQRPAFGERWASMWLDLVRYADSGGLGLDQRRTIWAYRDFVINAFNDDMPFDQFTIKQLAGDLLPTPTLQDLVATACQRNTQTNNEGGTDDEQFRMEAVIDRVNTTWQTWGAVTFGCVQCHSHPYDPFQHDEYYRFLGFYNNSADSDLSDDAPRLRVPTAAQDSRKAQQLRDQILNLKKKIWDAGIDVRDTSDWFSAKELSATSNKSTKYVVGQNEGVAEFHTVGTVETGTHTHLSIPVSTFGSSADGGVRKPNAKPLTALRLTVLPLDPDVAKHSPEWGFLIAKLEAWRVTKDQDGNDVRTPVTFRWSVADVPWMPTNPMKTVSGTGVNWGADSRIHDARQIVLVPSQPIGVEDGVRLDIHIHCNKTGHGSHPMAIDRGRVAGTFDKRWMAIGADHSETRRWQSELAATLKSYTAIPATSVPYMHERPAFLARPNHVFVRGNATDKGQLVTPGLPKSLTDIASVSSDNPSRLDMAQWWVSDPNPLTARVFANRVWEQLFGIGIVPTVEDFGSSGDRPTHPQLLDHLAVRFQKDHHWSVKKLIREVVLSHAFQQAAKVSPELVQRDPDNRLVARGPRLRLTAEMVRDMPLAVSGLLHEKLGGAPVRPPLPGGVWRPFDGGDKWQTAKRGEEDRYRRSIYTYVKRSIPFPSMATFDAPSREFCTPRRLTSNTPLQALVTLNDESFVEFAEAFGKRLKTEFEGELPQKLAAGHRLVTGRKPSSRRLSKLVQLFEQTQSAADPKSAESSKTPWTVIAQVLLNLDETLTW